MRKKLKLGLIGLLLAGATAFAADRFAIQVWGSFRQMSHTGNTTGVVKLSALGNARGTYGVGAVAGMRGEILQWDGGLLVSRGHSHEGETSPPNAGDEAVLFVQAKVDAWQEVPVAADMTQPQFEAFVLASAKKLGLQSDRAFPFAVRGDRLNVTWHVVTGAAAALGHHGSGMHDQGHAQAKTFREMGVSGTLLGFHTGAALEGTASHPGERFHVHYANPDMSASGHVDEYRVPGGAMLMLPRR